VSEAYLFAVGIVVRRIDAQYNTHSALREILGDIWEQACYYG
jgi:hypothetical protein